MPTPEPIKSPRDLKPADLCRLLNSTSLGEVIDERRLYRHRTRAGFRIGTGKHVDLFRYAAWLGEQVHRPRPEPPADPYAATKERARAKAAAISLAGRDIGELPPIENLPRRLQTFRNFRLFCETYFPITFHLAWSPDHLRVIAKIEEAVLRGGLFAMAMPRSTGKTSLVENACIWAMLHGHHEFICLIGSDEGHATDMLESIKTELDGNELLLADFPEALWPIQRLDGIANRCAGQLYHGQRTHIGWTAKEIVLPSVKPHGWSDDERLAPLLRADGHSLASGAIVRVAGITGRIRGMKFKRADGRTVRPSLVVPDDPQTDEAARSLSQCATRESILAGAVLGLAGPGKKISGIMPCTVIRNGDMADNILNREKHPEWNGERTKLVYQFPSNEALWRRYAELRADGLRRGAGITDATEFYRQNREAMDAGARVAWQQRFNYDELSAIQHAMNLRLQDEAAFFAEYQNEPLPDVSQRNEDLTADFIAAKLNGHPRGTLPIAAQHVTMFIDVQQKLLFYAVAAWRDDFTGYVIDYGTWPDQQRNYFALRDARFTLTHAFPQAGLEGSIYHGLQRLTDAQLSRDWPRDDGAQLRIERCLIDANWGQSTEVVYQFCRESPHAALITPSHGRYVGAASRPFSEYRRKPGDRLGQHWRMPATQGRRSVRYVLFDTNHWKSFVYSRLATPTGDTGSLTLFGHDAQRHRLFAEHLTAEYRIRTTGRGRELDEWRPRPNTPDNHWLDAVVGCAVAASMQGVAVLGNGTAGFAVQRQRISFAELQRSKRR